MATSRESAHKSWQASAQVSSKSRSHDARSPSSDARRMKRTWGARVDLYAALTRATGQMVWISLADGAVVATSSLTAFTGLAPAQIIGRGWLDAVHQDDRERVEWLWKHAVTSDAAFELEYRIRRRDGVYRRFAVRVAPVRGVDGVTRRWVSAADDVAERAQGDDQLEPFEEMSSARNIRGEASQARSAKDLTLRTSDGDDIGTVVVYGDMIKRQRLERLAADQNRQFKGAFDAIADSVVVFDSAGQIVRNNTADSVMFGFDTVAGRSPRSLEERSQWLALRDEQGNPLPHSKWPAMRVLRGEYLRGARAVEIKARALDGREVELSESGAPIYDEAGRLVGGVLVNRDITERKKHMQSTLNAVLSMAEALVEPMLTHDMMTSVDISAIMSRLGELARNILGCTRLSFVAVQPTTGRLKPMLRVGRPLEMEYRGRVPEGPPRLQDVLPEALIVRLRQGEVVVHEASRPKAPGWQFPGEKLVLIAPLLIESELIGLLALDYGAQSHHYSADERHMASAVAHSATVVIERDRLLREREEARASEMASREAARRMELFMAMASHEFRTPLTAIKRYLEVAERLLVAIPPVGDNTEPGANALDLTRMSLARADHAAAQVTGLLNDFLQVSRAQAGKLLVRPQLCDLAEIARRCVTEGQWMAPNREVRLHLPARRRVSMFADPDRIDQVITNYLTNAFKYAPDGQPIDVRVQLHGGVARVSVSDRGPGLSPFDQEHVWERFYQAADVRDQSGVGMGLGLGLYVCHMIIEQHDGHVGVESAMGKGSTFWFTLPLATRDA